MNDLKVTLLANAGILLRYKNTKLLLDGIHESAPGMFSGLSERLLAELLAGGGPLFRNIDYVLFTHCHPDHFTAWCTEAFLENNRVKGLLMPDRQTADLVSLRQAALRRAERTWLLDLPLGVRETIPLQEDISLTVFRSHHAGKQYAEIENFCYLLDFAGRKVFIIGDGDYDAAYFARMLAGETIETAFVNPLFINLAEGREVLAQAVKPARVVVYHIPFVDRDKGFRRLVRRDIEKYQNSLPPLAVLWDELQEMTL
ncbi:MBL fold metallo-hydrolase [Anaeroselena agilis]|uniref:MBL fold metallo-hydrolase n=1 Tax=Anaeroselena agilis TaxID=3063788 RepID=A0ABU3P0I6_9FIRM|nr:MBL fold metallo-hydrolase [Selenomonadales bacterium 4137-cl]